MTTFTVILLTQGGVPVGACGFYDFDDACGYAADWPGIAEVVDFATGELLFSIVFAVDDDAMPS